MSAIQILTNIGRSMRLVSEVSMSMFVLDYSDLTGINIYTPLWFGLSQSFQGGALPDFR